MNWFKDLVTENPMLVEIKRFTRRLTTTRGASSNVAVVILIALFYAILVASIANARGVIDPVYIAMFQLGIFTLMTPIMMAASIAGERERRTWDLLLAAPITKAQIVAGKFLAGAAALGAMAVANGVLILIPLVSNPYSSFGLTFLAELESLSVGVFLLALCLWISSRCQTNHAALGAGLGAIFTWMIILPTLVLSILSGTNGHDWIINLSPFGLIANLADARAHPLAELGAWTYCTSAIYLGLAALMVIASTISVRKMEEIKDLAAAGPQAEKGFKGRKGKVDKANA